MHDDWMSEQVNESMSECECVWMWMPLCVCVCLFMAKARRKTFCALISCPCGSLLCLHTFPPLTLLLPAPLGLIINWKICLFCKFAREQNQSVCMEFPNSCAYFSSLISCFVLLSVSPFMASPYVATRAGGQAQRPCVHVETKWEKEEGKRKRTRHKGYAC